MIEESFAPTASELIARLSKLSDKALERFADTQAAISNDTRCSGDVRNAAFQQALVGYNLQALRAEDRQIRRDFQKNLG